MDMTKRIAGWCCLLALVLVAGCEGTQTIKTVDQDKPDSGQQLADAKAALAECQDDLAKSEAKANALAAELDRNQEGQKKAAQMSAQLRAAERELDALRKELAVAKKQKDAAQSELKRFQQRQLEESKTPKTGEQSELKEFQQKQQKAKTNTGQ